MHSGTCNKLFFFRRNTLVGLEVSYSPDKIRRPKCLQGCSFFESFFCSRQLIKIQKKDSKNGASQQTFGPFYFVRALTSRNLNCCGIYFLKYYRKFYSVMCGVVANVGHKQYQGKMTGFSLSPNWTTLKLHCPWFFYISSRLLCTYVSIVVEPDMKFSTL